MERQSIVGKIAWMVLVVLALVGVAIGAAWREGWVRSPWAGRYVELEAQLRDRGPVAVVGGSPIGLRVEGVPLLESERDVGLSGALSGRDGVAVSRAMRTSHVDALLVRPGASASQGSVASTLARAGSVRGLNAVYLDETATLYEASERVEISDEDARRMVAVSRLILSGAVAPPERLFPESLRRSRPVELALIVRDGHEAILWRSSRSGSLARALLDVSIAVVDRWATRQQERFGRLRDAMRNRVITLAVFYDKGVLGVRDTAFLQRTASGRGWSLGYERLTGWEYALPVAPWETARDPVQTLTTLTRERGVPAPGYLRPELTLYRFRALQIIEQTPEGAIEQFDPE